MKRLGPELKLSSLRSVKVPSVFGDLYHDLRDRRLLPLVALIAIAIVAVPFLLKGGAEDVEPPSALPPPEAANPSANASLTVVPAAPGLRDYRKRLRHRDATDPFKPRFTGPVLEGTQLGAGSPETSTTTTTESSDGSSVASTGADAGAPSASAGGSPAVPPDRGDDDGDEGPVAGDDGITFFTFAIDVKITKTTTEPSGRKSKPEVLESDRVLPPASLPGKKTEVLTYIGLSPKTRKPLFLVSEDVTSIFGDVKCLSGSGRCQLVELEQGLPVTFLYGENDVRYKINLLDVEAVSTGDDDS